MDLLSPTSISRAHTQSYNRSQGRTANVQGFCCFQKQSISSIPSTGGGGGWGDMNDYDDDILQ